MIRIWIIVSLLFIKTNNRSLAIPISYNYYPDYISGELSLGTPPIAHRFMLSTSTFFSVVYQNHRYNETISSTIHISPQQTTQYNSFKGNFSFDTMAVNSIPIQNFQFILIDEREIKYPDALNQGIIALSRATSSLLSQLYYPNVIHQRQFQFHQKKLIFGDYNNNNPNLTNYTSSRCHLISYSHLWACLFKGVSFKGNLGHINLIDSKVIFSLDRRNIVFPFDFWPIFKYQYFGSAYEETCNAYENPVGWVIECDEEVVPHLGDIYLYIGNDVKLRLNYSDLFEEDMLDMDKRIFKLLFRKNATEIEIGWKILEKFSIGLNDNEDYAEFFIYNETNLDNTEDEKKKSKSNNMSCKRLVFVPCIFVLIFGCIILFITQYKSKFNIR